MRYILYNFLFVFCFLTSVLCLLPVRTCNSQHKVNSTTVENIRQIRLFLQKNSDFPHFSLENEDLTQKQTQYKPNQSQLLQRLKMIVFARKMSFTIVYCDFLAVFTTLKGADIKGDKTKTKPIPTVIPLPAALMIDVYFQAAYNGKANF